MTDRGFPPSRTLCVVVALGLLAACENDEGRELTLTVDDTTLSVSGQGQPSQTRVGLEVGFAADAIEETEVELLLERELAWVAGSAERFDGQTYVPVAPDSVTVDGVGRTTVLFDLGDASILLFLRFRVRAAEPGLGQIEVEVRFGSTSQRESLLITVVA